MAACNVSSVAFNRTVLVTGATKGIGRALSLELVSQGCRVLACGRSKCDLESLSGEWANPSFHRCQVLDVSNDDEVARWREDLEREDIVPDLIVNNAGVTNNLAPLWELSNDDFAAVIQVNVLGRVCMLRAAQQKATSEAFAFSLTVSARVLFQQVTSSLMCMYTKLVFCYCYTLHASPFTRFTHRRRVRLHMYRVFVTSGWS